MTTLKIRHTPTVSANVDSWDIVRVVNGKVAAVVVPNLTAEKAVSEWHRIAVWPYAGEIPGEISKAIPADALDNIWLGNDTKGHSHLIRRAAAWIGKAWNSEDLG